MNHIRRVRCARRNVRRMLGVLCGVTSLEILRMVFLPTQPSLPEPPTAAELSPLWSYARRQTIGKTSAIGLVQGSIARGASQRLERNGTWVIVTPIATWQLKELNPSTFTKSLTYVAIKNPKLLTLSPTDRQVALGLIKDTAVAQTCLTPEGEMAFSADRLINLARHKDPGFISKALQSFLPSHTRGYSCLLVTTNNPNILKEQKIATSLITALTIKTDWPK